MTDALKAERVMNELVQRIQKGLPHAAVKTGWPQIWLNREVGFPLITVAPFTSLSKSSGSARREELSFDVRVVIQPTTDSATEMLRTLHGLRSALFIAGDRNNQLNGLLLEALTESEPVQINEPVPGIEMVSAVFTFKTTFIENGA
ncbi:MAG: hypothetical protein ACRCYN_00485 [Plesiomonas sp.]